MKKQDLSVKNVVAMGIGSAIYVILARFTSIPTPIPNTNIELVFPFLALFAAIYRAKVGFAVGFIGHTLSDFIMYGQTWWSWVLATGVLGLIIGLASKKLDLKNGIFGIKHPAVMINRTFTNHNTYTSFHFYLPSLNFLSNIPLRFCYS